MHDEQTKRVVLTISIISSFVTPFMGSSINIAIPAIGNEFRADAILLSWIPTAFLLAAATFLLPFGRLADIYGRKKIFLYGTVVFTAGSLLCALSSSVPTLIFFRIIQGVGSSMIFATGMAIITSVFPPQERGKVMGIVVGFVYVGLSIGPLVGGLLTHHFSWRTIFLVTVPLGLTIITLVLWKLKAEWAEARGEPFDAAGSVIYGLGIVGIMYGLTLLPSLGSLWLIVFGALALFAFVKWELRVKNPVFRLDLFRTNRVFAFSNLAALINYSASFAVVFLLSLYLQQIRGYSAQAAGFILIAQSVVMAAFSPLAGWLSDRFDARLVASLGMVLTTLGLFVFCFLSQESTIGFIMAGLVVLGLGFAFFSSPNTNAIMSSVERRYYGIASGSVGTMRLLGMLFSMGIATLSFSLFMGRVQITPQYYPAFVRAVRTSFIIFSCLCFTGVFAAAVRGEGENAAPERPESTGP